MDQIEVFWENAVDLEHLNIILDVGLDWTVERLKREIRSKCFHYPPVHRQVLSLMKFVEITDDGIVFEELELRDDNVLLHTLGLPLSGYISLKRMQPSNVVECRLCQRRSLMPWTTSNWMETKIKN